MTLAALLAYFFRLGATGFGGPAALTERMRRDLVETRGALSPEEFDMGLAIAAASPGPLAFQLAVFCGYIRHGVHGAAGVAVAFALAPFALVVAIAALYGRYSDRPILSGIFYGVSPVVLALIVRACWALGGRTLGAQPRAWVVAGVVLITSLVTGREPTWLILAAGALGAVLFGPGPVGTRRSTSSPPASGAATAMVAFVSTGASAAGSGAVFSFFFKTGCFVFGSGLVIAPFLRASVVTDFQWLTEQQFRDAIAVGLVSPGPVVITATFVGYVVDGFSGAVAATAGIFAPAVLFTLLLAPVFARHGGDRRVQGFIRGVTAAVVGVLAATAPLLASTTVVDPATGLIFVATLAWLGFERVPEPVVVGAGALAGLAVRFWG